MLLELICILCGAGLACGGIFGFWKPINWWDYIYIILILFIAGWIAGIGVIFLVEWFAGLFVNKKKPYEKVSKWARFWYLNGIWFIQTHALIHVEYHGIRKMPQHEKFMLVCNHKSKFDNFVISNKFGKLDIAFVTKQENAKIPVAGAFLPGMCYLAVDRDDKLQSLEAFKRGVHLIQNDVTSIGVFPEGTRQEPDVVLGDFHEGVFNIAIHAKAPIVVTTITNTEKVHKRWPFRMTKVRYDILEVIPYEEYEDMPAKALSDRVHKIMEDHLLKVR